MFDRFSMPHKSEFHPVILADIGGTEVHFALLVGTDIGPLETCLVAEFASPVDAARAFPGGPAGRHALKRALFVAAGHGETAASRLPMQVECSTV
jgi:glucokinase